MHDAQLGSTTCSNMFKKLKLFWDYAVDSQTNKKASDPLHHKYRMDKLDHNSLIRICSQTHTAWSTNIYFILTYSFP
jgi:hypothetical protein